MIGSWRDATGPGQKAGRCGVFCSSPLAVGGRDCSQPSSTLRQRRGCPRSLTHPAWSMELPPTVGHAATSNRRGAPLCFAAARARARNWHLPMMGSAALKTRAPPPPIPRLATWTRSTSDRASGSCERAPARETWAGMQIEAPTHLCPRTTAVSGRRPLI